LGCTHYPLLKKTIQLLIPNDIKIIDSGRAVAAQTKRLLVKNKLETNLYEPKYSFYCSGSTKSLNNILNNKFIINTI
jgi:glutamate racemase